MIRTPEQHNRDYWTLKAMSQYGGGFVKALSHAAMQADDDNIERIKKAFPEYWSDYEETGKKLEAHDL